MTELVFIGGAKGVGKSTLISRVAELHPEYDYAHPGDIYWQNTDRPLQEVANIITNSILAKHAPLVIVDTHYAAYYKPNGWQACWSRESLDRIASAAHVNSVSLYLIDALPSEVYDRRTKDQEKKRRLDMDSVVAELILSRRYFEQACAHFRQYNMLSNRAIIANHEQEKATTELDKLLAQEVVERREPA